MAKKKSLLLLEAYSDDDLVSSVYYPIDKAEDTFLYYIQIAVKIKFPTINRFRLLSGGHILFEFRDIRKIVNQKEFML